ncbi:matrix-remodeling-associated protein 7 [Aotus nancymaae]|uniref:matrix-remodeling-associated protein 7 n=1 Tax=Aotus nancymaae TaxID=37293 RepID=UPI0030FF2866
MMALEPFNSDTRYAASPTPTTTEFSRYQVGVLQFNSDTDSLESVQIPQVRAQSTDCPPLQRPITRLLKRWSSNFGNTDTEIVGMENNEEEQDLDGEKGPSSAGPEEEDGEGFSFKYSPGKLRGNQYKKMMTKEELEEEQRVQKEQLAAIFKLMKDNKETFGEMSDGDVQEQLRLYDM